MNRTTHSPAVWVWVTGAVIAIFSLVGSCATGAVMAMLCFCLLPPKIIPREQAKALAGGLLLLAGDGDLGDGERRIAR